MNIEETKKLMAVIALEHGAFNMGEARAKLWHKLLEKHDYVLAVQALENILSKSRFEPKAADIIEEITSIAVSTDAPNSIHAWNLAGAACSKGTSEAFENLPTAVRQTIRKVGAFEIRTSTRPDKMRDVFMQTYAQLVGEMKQTHREKGTLETVAYNSNGNKRLAA